ncbi:acetate uptake transporter [Methanoregula sp.]|uniref:acetate uptake transporter n=1 Tax=Methanoregula sp. TaxID=2052170 RepID=UPI003563FB09
MTETTTNKCSVVEIKDITGGAGALGLLGYGMPGVLVSLANAGIIQAGSAILGMVIFMGGFAMLAAGLMEWKKGNTYGMAAYGCYGLFWFSFAALLLLPALGLVKDTGGAGAMAAYLALWGLFTLILFIGSLKMSRALQFVLGTLAIVFFLEAAGAATGTGMFTVLAGYVGIISGFSAIYTALAPVLNEVYGKTIAPIG